MICLRVVMCDNQQRETVPKVQTQAGSRNTDVNRPAPARRVLAKLGLAFAGVLIGLILTEIGLRAIGVKYDGSFYVRDFVRGWALRPDSEGWWVSEGNSYVRINSDGMHDREYSVPKPSHTFRIAVLGDSLTAARQVPLEKNFCSVIRDQLSKCGSFTGERIEVLNFGVDGYGTAQELLTLRDHVWKYEPDLVLLAFFPGNDVYNNYRELQPFNADYAPYFLIRDNQLVLDDSFRDVIRRNRQLQLEDALGGVTNHIRLLQLANTVVVRDIVNRQQHHSSYNRQFAKFGRHYEECLVYEEPAIPEMKESWDITERLLLTMRDEVQAHHAEFRIALLTTEFQVYPDPQVRQEHMKLCGVNTLFYPDNRLEAFGEQKSIPVIALGPALAPYAEQNKVYLHGFLNTHLGTGHLNETGHLMTGKTIAARICAAHGEAKGRAPGDP